MNLREARELTLLTLEQAGIQNTPRALVDRYLNEGILRFATRKPEMYREVFFYVGSGADATADKLYTGAGSASFTEAFNNFNLADVTPLKRPFTVSEVWRDGDRLEYSPNASLNDTSYYRTYSVVSDYTIFLNQEVDTGSYIVVIYYGVPAQVTESEAEFDLPVQYELMPFYYAVQHIAADNANQGLMQLHLSRYHQMVEEACRASFANGSFQIKPVTF
jgi:hypothetical protein